MYAGVSLDQAPPEDIPSRFFITAPLFGIIAGILIMFKGEEFFLSNWSMETIALTHLFTLGWLAMIMMGSFYQMVPVLVGGAVPYIKFSRIIHALFTLAVLLLFHGIYLMHEILLISSSFLLFVSLGFFIIQVGIALIRVKADRPTVVAMRMSIVCLFITVALGLYFTGGHGGFWELPDDRAGMTGIHMMFGLFGWVGCLIIGVGFHVIPMFYMTPDFPKKKSSIILMLYGISLFALPLTILIEASNLIKVTSGMPGLVAFAMFSFTIISLVEQRKRKITDPTMKAWKIGIVILNISLLLLLAENFIVHDSIILLFGILFIIGFGLTVTMGMLYKIMPFLVWFHRFSNLIGKVKVPLMHNISPNKTAWRQIVVYLVSLTLLIIALIFSSHVLFQIAGFTFALSSLMLFVNLLKMIMIKTPEIPQEHQ